MPWWRWWLTHLFLLVGIGHVTLSSPLCLPASHARSIHFDDLHASGIFTWDYLAHLGGTGRCGAGLGWQVRKRGGVLGPLSYWSW